MSGLTWGSSATTVSSGESATNLLIRLFDTLLVDHGGTVTDSIVTGAGLGVQGGTVDEDPPGSALVFGTISKTQIGGDVVSAGTTYTGGGAVIELGSGGLALNTVITVAGGTLQVDSGATARGVTDAGDVVIAAGGKAFGVTDDGDESVAGGTVSNTTINFGAFGGSQEITGGGVAYNTTLKGHDSIQTITDGTASATTLTGSGAQQIVSSGGHAISTTLGSDTFSFVSSGGATTSTTIGKGGVEIVLAGGSAVDTTVDSGGILLLLGGSLTSDVVQSGGTVIDSGVVVLRGSVSLSYPSGSTPVETLNIDGKIVKFYPHVASDVTVSTNEVAFVLKGGRALGMTDDTYMAVGSSGYASATKVEAAASLLVDAGGSAQATDVLANVTQDADDVGSVTVLSGGRVTSTTVNTAALTVSAGGFAGDTTLSGSTYTSISSNGDGGPAPAYGTEYVLAHGVATGITLDSLGELVDAGVAGGILINNGGVAIVEHGARTVGTQITNGGVEEIYGVASQTAVSSYGREVVEKGGLAVATDMVSYGFVVVSGAAVHLLDAGGGEVSAMSGARVTDSTIGNGGDQIVSSGAVAISTYLSGGGEGVYGKAYDTYTDGDGGEDVYTGGETFNDVMSGEHGDETAFGGIASATTAEAGGELTVDPGGTAISALILGGGFIAVDGGLASNTLLESGATMTVYYPTGSAVGTVVDSGGYVSASDSGRFISGIIDGGASIYLIDGAVASALTVLSGGLAIVDGGGSFNSPPGLLAGAVISSGGRLEVLGSGYFSGFTGVTVSKGGILEVGGLVVSSGQVVRTPGVQQAATNFSGVAVRTGGIVDYVNAIVSSGGELVVPKGATAYDPEVNTSGELLISAGGTAVYGDFVGGATVIDNGAIVIDEAASNGNVTLYTPISGTGGIQVEGSGSLLIEPVNSFAGGITLDSGVTLTLLSAGAAGTGPIDMAGAPIGGATITLAYALPSNTFATTVSGFGLGDAIVLDGIGYSSSDSVVVSGNAVTLELPTTSFTFDIVGASADKIVVGEAPGNVAMLSAIAPSPPPMAAAFLVPAGGSAAPAEPPTLAQALSAGHAFQAQAASAALFGSEGLGGPGDAPVSVHLGGMLTEIHAGGLSTPFAGPPISAA